MKKLFISAIACLLSSVALADEVTVTWTSINDPQVGWNLYMNHLQTPDALQYLGTTGASSRSTTFHNVSSTGLYQFGISRVNYVNDSGVNRRVEGPVRVITILNGVVIDTPRGVNITSVTISP